MPLRDASAMLAAARTVASQGFVVVPSFLSKAEVAQLRRGAHNVVQQFVREQFGAENSRNPSRTPSIFTTKEQDRHSDNTFLESADKVDCFFEERAMEKDADGTTRLRAGVDPMLSVNKAGHALHELIPEFRDFLHGERRSEFAGLSRALLGTIRGGAKSKPAPQGGDEPLVVQDMYIFKQPNVGGEVSVHQDNTFLHTAPTMSCFGLWLALDDCDLTNGCLWAVPGSHTSGIVSRMVRNANSEGTSFIPPHPDHRAPWKTLDEEFGASPRDPAAKHPWVPLCVESGTLVVLHGNLVHASEPNTSPRTRHAYAVHVTSNAADCKWSPDNWMVRRPENPFKGF